MEKCIALLTVLFLILTFAGCTNLQDSEAANMASEYSDIFDSQINDDTESEAAYTVSEYGETIIQNEDDAIETIDAQIDDDDKETAAGDAVNVSPNDEILEDPEEAVDNTKTQLEDITPDNAIKVYYLNNPDVVAGYKSTYDLGSNITDEYFIQVNLIEERSTVQFIKNKDDTWEVGVIGGGLDIPDEEPTSAVPLSENEMIARVAQEVETVTDLRYVAAPMYFMKFVYFKSEGIEYIIPVSRRPDFTELINGDVYEAGEAMDVLSHMFDEDK